MMKRTFALFLVLALSGIGCVPPPPPPGHPSKISRRVPVPPPPPANNTEAAMAVEAGVIAAGIGLTILDIILSGQGPRRGARSGPVRPPR